MTTNYTSDSLFIDAVFIDGVVTDDGSKVANMLNYADNVPEEFEVVKGRKWMVQITNNSNSAHDFSTNNVTLQLCTEYLKNDGDEEYDDFDLKLNWTTGTLGPGKSMFAGWINDSGAADGGVGDIPAWGNISNTASSFPVQNSVGENGGDLGTLNWMDNTGGGTADSDGRKYCPLIPDQTATVGSAAATARTRVRLFVSNVPVDVAFDNSITGGGGDGDDDADATSLSLSGGVNASSGNLRFQGIYNITDSRGDPGNRFADAASVAGVKVKIGGPSGAASGNSNAANSFVARRRPSDGDGGAGKGWQYVQQGAAQNVPPTAVNNIVHFYPDAMGVTN